MKINLKQENQKSLIVDSKQQGYASDQQATKSRESEEQIEETNSHTETSQQLKADSKQQLESLTEETLELVD